MPARPWTGGRLTDQDVRKVAADANVDPRTVRRSLEGARQSKVVRAAVAASLRKLGFKQEARRIDGGEDA